MTNEDRPRIDLDSIAALRRFDAAVDAVFDGARRSTYVDRLFYAASEAGNFSAIWHALAWGEVLLVRSPASIRRAATTSAALIAESVIVNGPLKSAFKRSRPQVTEPRTHKLRTPLTSSFPSGHASAAAVALMMLGRRRALAAPVAVVGVVVSASRVHVRIHHPSDVVGGVIAGVVLGAMAKRVGAGAL